MSASTATRGPDPKGSLVTVKPADPKAPPAGLFSPERSSAPAQRWYATLMVEALRANATILLIVLNTLVVGLVVGGILCATLICR
jgi:hypothetical protein